jgi:hypothetical protein
MGHVQLNMLHFYTLKSTGCSPLRCSQKRSTQPSICAASLKRKALPCRWNQHFVASESTIIWEFWTMVNPSSTEMACILIVDYHTHVEGFSNGHGVHHVSNLGHLIIHLLATSILQVNRKAQDGLCFNMASSCSVTSVERCAQDPESNLIPVPNHREAFV